MITIGAKVCIKSAHYGFGDMGVGVGDIGTVRTHEPGDDGRRYYIDIPNKHSGWVCVESDLEVCTERVLAGNHATQFINRMRDDCTHRVQKAREVYDAESRNITTLENKLNGIVTPDTDLVNAVKQRVENLIFRDAKMYFTTQRCYVPFEVRGCGSTTVDVGEYDVTVDFNSGHVRVVQRIPEKYMVGQYDHPHVNRQEVCWGSYHETKNKLIRLIDIVGMINLILDFLNSCDRHGWYCPIFSWMTDEQRRLFTDLCDRCWHSTDECECEFCGNCDNIQDECSCSYCDHCDAYNDDCECARCPDSHERLEDGQFPDRMCVSCSQLVRNLDDEQWQCSYYGLGRDAHFCLDLCDFTPSGTSQQYRTLTNGVLNERTT